MEKLPRESLTDDDLRALAKKARVDPRTILKALAGIRSRGYAGERARAVVAKSVLPPDGEMARTDP
jgi:hypothetical protein